MRVSRRRILGSVIALGIGVGTLQLVPHGGVPSNPPVVREHFNVSEWHREQKDAHEAAEEVSEGEMPLWFYEPFHPGSWLSAEERGELIAGLEATFGVDSRRRRRGD